MNVWSCLVKVEEYSFAIKYVVVEKMVAIVTGGEVPGRLALGNITTKPRRIDEDYKRSLDEIMERRGPRSRAG